MSLFSLKNRFKRKNRKTQNRRSLRLEGLEERQLLAVTCGTEAAAALMADIPQAVEVPAETTAAVPIEIIDPISDQVGSIDQSVTITLTDHFSGDYSDNVAVTFTDQTGKTVDISQIAILKSVDYNAEDKTVTFTMLKSADYASALDLSAVNAAITVTDDAGTSSASGTFKLSLAEQTTAKISLVAVSAPTTEGVTRLATGASNFGTFYYVNAEDIPQTDPDAVADTIKNEGSFYLEIWAQDLSFSITDRQQFVSSLQIQLNYETDTDIIYTVELEDVYAGKTSLDRYTYYDTAQTQLKGIQLTWLFNDAQQWSLLSPITSGENAYLLARLVVTANAESTEGASINLSGITNAKTPFVEGWYYVRTGDSYKNALDESQIETTDASFTAPKKPEIASAVVTTALDVVDVYDGLISLREAVNYITSGAVAETTVTFDASLAGSTITLDAANGQITISESLSIDASALEGGISVVSGGNFRVFYLLNQTKNIDIELNYLTIANGKEVYGAGIYNSGENLTLINCVIKDCAASYAGGGIYNVGTMTAVNSLIVNNSSKVYAGGIYNNKKITFTNVTMTENSAGTGGGIYTYGSSAAATLQNSIMVNNTGTDGADIYLRTGKVIGTNVLTSFTAWSAGSVNTYVYDEQEPLFTNAKEKDYSLAEDSQAIDLGDNAYVTVEKDLAGENRISREIVDLGAYEFQFALLPLSAPVNLKAASNGANTHRISWDAVENADGYQLSYSVDLENWIDVLTSENSCVVTGLTYASIVSYRVKALGDGNVYDDSKVSESISQRVCPMDMNGDGKIGLSDYTIFSQAWMSSLGDANWDARSDITGDGRVNLADYRYFSQNYQKNADDPNLVYPEAKSAFAEEADDLEFIDAKTASLYADAAVWDDPLAIDWDAEF